MTEQISDTSHAPPAPIEEEQRQRLRLHTKAFLARAPLSMLLTEIASVVRASAEQENEPVHPGETAKDAASIAEVADRLHWKSERYGAPADIDAAFDADRLLVGPSDDEVNVAVHPGGALHFLYGARVGDETAMDALKRLVATARDHSDVGELLQAEGRNETPPRSLMQPVRDLLASMVRASSGSDPVLADAYKILDALRDASMGTETELETVLRLVRDARFAQAPTNDASGNHYQTITNALFAVRQGSEFALETLARLVKEAQPNTRDLTVLALRGAREGEETYLETARRLVEDSVAKAKLDANPRYRPEPWKFLTEAGLLGKINTDLLHPLGMAIEVAREADGSCSFAGLWWDKEDPEGIIFSEASLVDINAKLAAYMKAEGSARLNARRAALGFVRQGHKARTDQRAAAFAKVRAELNEMLNAPIRVTYSTRGIEPTEATFLDMTRSFLDGIGLAVPAKWIYSRLGIPQEIGLRARRALVLENVLDKAEDGNVVRITITGDDLVVETEARPSTPAR